MEPAFFSCMSPWENLALAQAAHSVPAFWIRCSPGSQPEACWHFFFLSASPVPFGVPSWNVSLQASLTAWKVGGEGGQCAYVSFLLLWHLFTRMTMALLQPWPTLGSGNAILLLFPSPLGGIKRFLLGAFVALILTRFLQMVLCGVNSLPFQDM